jgi:hypothetical protein
MFDRANHYWIVGGDETRRYSSAAGAYVPATDAAYLAWREAGEQRYGGDITTRIDSAAELVDVLRAASVEPGADLLPGFDQTHYAAAISAHLDATARSRGYDGTLSIATYVGSSVPQWAAEAAAFALWRDQVWAYAYAELAKVQAGQRQQPTVADLIAELPAITWPA